MWASYLRFRERNLRCTPRRWISRQPLEEKRATDAEYNAVVAKVVVIQAQRSKQIKEGRTQQCECSSTVQHSSLAAAHSDLLHPPPPSARCPRIRGVGIWGVP